MDLDLTGHVAVVTGGASGIGLACAKALAQEGCRVAIWDLAQTTRDAAAGIEIAFGTACAGLIADIRDFAVVEDAVRQTERELGSISHLVHAAAAGSGKFGFPFSNLQPSDWAKVLEINILGMVNVAHAIAPRMVERRTGTIVFIGSVAGQIGSQSDPPYSASKAAGINFAQCLAKDLAIHDVRVNTVNPGMVQTPLNRNVWKAWNDLQPPANRRSYEAWGLEKVQAIAPLGRWQEAEDIADMVAFLSSCRARQVTGQTINVDGGQVMHW